MQKIECSQLKSVVNTRSGERYIEQFADITKQMPQFVEALYQAGKKSKHKK